MIDQEIRILEQHCGKMVFRSAGFSPAVFLRSAALQKRRRDAGVTKNLRFDVVHQAQIKKVSSTFYNCNLDSMAQ
jgi:hypothetical protein